MGDQAVRYVASFFLAALLSSGTDAAELKKVDSKDKKTRIDLIGEIVEGDADKLKAMVKEANDAQRVVVTIRLNSIGGNLLEGVKISDVVKFGRMATAVLSNSTCASACFIIFAAGQERYAHYAARVGVHGASNQEGQETTQSGAATVTMGRLVSSLGVPPGVIGKMVVTPPSEMVWLSVDDLRSMNVTMLGKPQQLPPEAQAPPQQLPSPGQTTAQPPPLVAQTPVPNFQPGPSRQVPPSIGANVPDTSRHSANHWMPGCRGFLDDKNNFGLVDQGRCSGALQGVVFSDPRVCAPPNSTIGQNIRIVIQYIDNRPARQHESFLQLATEALREVWPCSR
jgi:hypothetical protein